MRQNLVFKIRKKSNFFASFGDADIAARMDSICDVVISGVAEMVFPIVSVQRFGKRVDKWFVWVVIGIVNAMLGFGVKYMNEVAMPIKELSKVMGP